MSESQGQSAEPLLDEDEDTAETSLRGKFFLWRWYRRTTLGFGRSRPFFMPLGYLSLAMLAFFFGLPALEDLVDSLLIALHRGLSGLGALLGASGAGLDGTLALPVRRVIGPALALAWSIAAVALLTLGAIDSAPEEADLGYVVPGSGILARAWGVIGKRFYALRQVIMALAGYLRDLNLQKVILPVNLACLLALGWSGTAVALGNLLAEIPIYLPRMSGHWIPAAAQLGAGLFVLVLGLPLTIGSLRRAHRRSVRQRKDGKVKFVRRRLTGLLSLLFVSPPLVWMTLSWLAGRLG